MGDGTLNRNRSTGRPRQLRIGPGARQRARDTATGATASAAAAPTQLTPHAHGDFHVVRSGYTSDRRASLHFCRRLRSTSACHPHRCVALVLVFRALAFTPHSVLTRVCFKKLGIANDALLDALFHVLKYRCKKREQNIYNEMVDADVRLGAWDSNAQPAPEHSSSSPSTRRTTASACSRNLGANRPIRRLCSFLPRPDGSSRCGTQRSAPARSAMASMFSIATISFATCEIFRRTCSHFFTRHRLARDAAL